jgi:hypothetical protein
MIKFLEAQLGKLPKMASGGVVTSARNIVAGEAGPEAILPLSRFGDMLGSLPVFQGIQHAVEKIGDAFSGAGNTGMANKYFANLAKVQHTYDYTMDRIYNSRRVDFTPESMRHRGASVDPYLAAVSRDFRSVGGHGGGGGGGMFSLGNMNLHFHGVDISAPGAASSFAQKLLPALDAEAKRAGVNVMGRSALRAGGANTSGRAYGYNR